MGVVKYTGPMASFHCPTNAEIRSLKVHFSPKQEGSGDPSPENVREIVGWDGVEVYRNTSTTNYEFGVLGKNKFNKNDSEKIISGLQILSSEKIGGSSTSTTVFVPCQPNTTYTISKLATARAAISYAITDTIPQIDDSIYGYQNIANQSTATIATGDNAKWLCIYITNTNYDSTSVQDILDSLQVELGSSATTYEPYDPNHTVYGGWVDLITGEVASTYIHCKIKDLPGEWNYRSGNNRFQITLTDDYANAASSGRWTHFATSEVYKTSTSNGYGNKQIAAYIDKHIYIRDDDFEGDVEEFLSGVGDTYITYELAESTTYSLSPTSMQTFLGQNNVWSNADYVEVEYDLHETQTILARKQFIIANQPHIEKPAAAPLQNFVTDMVAPLKECKVGFKPVQEGTGNPSPDNIRPISGWTELGVTGCGKNLFNKNDVESGYISAVTTSTRQLGEIIPDNNWRTSNYILVAPLTTYTLSMPNQINASVAGLVMYSDKEVGKEINGFSLETMKMRQNYYYTFTTPSNCYYIRFAMSANYIDTVQFEIGSASTEYESYTGTTIPITFPSEARTVYGGYVDLVKGELIQEYELATDTWGNIKNSSINSTTGYQYGCLFFQNPVVKAGMSGVSKVSYCNVGKYAWNLTNNATPHFYIDIPSNTEKYIAYITLSSTTDDNLLITCAAKLISPIIHQLTPQQLKTLRGTNNIWSSANGDIEIKYWTH